MGRAFMVPPEKKSGTSAVNGSLDLRAIEWKILMEAVWKRQRTRLASECFLEIRYV